MRAKTINEEFDMFTPKSFDQIISDLGLDKSRVDEILIKGIENSQPMLIDYALKNGANILWFQSGGPLGGHKYDLMYDSPMFVKIVGIRMPKNTKPNDNLGYHEKTKFRIEFRIVGRESNDDSFKQYSSDVLTSELFYRKFSPITNDEVQAAIQKIKQIEQRLEIINNLSK